MLKLVFSNLVQRPTRTCISVLAVALAVALLLVSLGLSYGQLADTAERTKGMGGALGFGAGRFESVIRILGFARRLFYNKPPSV